MTIEEIVDKLIKAFDTPQRFIKVSGSLSRQEFLAIQKHFKQIQKYSSKTFLLIRNKQDFVVTW